MNFFKIVSFSLLFFVVGQQSIFASSGDCFTEGRNGLSATHSKGLPRDSEEFLRSACVYLYDEDQEKETSGFSPAESASLLVELKKFGPVHVNLIERELGDGTLDKLLPFAEWIYALSLDGNFFSNEELTKIGQFKQLRYVDLTNTLPLVKTTLTFLRDLPHLSCVDITYNNGLARTNEVESLKKARPALKIIDEQ